MIFGFENASFEQLTRIMLSLEEEILRQQRYIAKHGENNDKNPDSAWLSYKSDAEFNLKAWDKAKQLRDKLK